MVKKTQLSAALIVSFVLAPVAARAAEPADALARLELQATAVEAKVSDLIEDALGSATDAQAKFERSLAKLEADIDKPLSTDLSEEDLEKHRLELAAKEEDLLRKVQHDVTRIVRDLIKDSNGMVEHFVDDCTKRGFAAEAWYIPVTIGGVVYQVDPVRVINVAK